MKSLALWVIAVCYVANTVEVYYVDGVGFSFFFGNFGYYSEMDEQ